MPQIYKEVFIIFSAKPDLISVSLEPVHDLGERRKEQGENGRKNGVY